MFTNLHVLFRSPLLSRARSLSNRTKPPTRSRLTANRTGAWSPDTTPDPTQHAVLTAVQSVEDRLSLKREGGGSSSTASGEAKELGVPAKLSFGDDSTPPPHHGFALFDRILETDDVAKWAGVAQPKKIVRQLSLSLVPDAVSTLSGAVTALRECLHSCNIAANQEREVKNSYILRVALLQSIFVRTLPLPLPITHPNRSIVHPQPLAESILFLLRSHCILDRAAGETSYISSDSFPFF